MNRILILIVLLSFSSFSGLAMAADESLIENDVHLCGSVERNTFKELVINLKKRYNTTLEESYFRIKCGGKDILGMVVDAPADRYFVGRELRKYFERKIGKPEMFSKVLVNEINSRDILSRIDYTLKEIKGTDLESLYDKKLNLMKKKYTAYLKKYPVPGSVESLKAAKP